MSNSSREVLVARTTGGRLLAPYAEDHRSSRGRLIRETASRTRTDFQRDRDRVIHCDAFRRLKHKTQVFVHHEGDHYRTRLTHTIEVGQIARALARALQVDEDLAEALALVHDFGHTPFGHAGERAMNVDMQDWGGFDHNAQSLRVVTELERRYAEFDGLNLTWETLEGLAKHNGPLTDRDGDGLDGPLPGPMAAYNDKHDLQLWSWPSIEAQCAAIADEIAYDNHDIDDGLRAGLFRLEDLEAVPFCAGFLEQVRSRYPGLEESRIIHELVRRQITAMVEDVIVEAVGRIDAAAPSCADDIRRLDYGCVVFSPAMAAAEKNLKAFLFANMYRHEDVVKATRAGEQIMHDLFSAYFHRGDAMPDTEEWSLAGLPEQQRARRVADFLAGMTDRYAISEHQRLFDVTPELR